MSETALQLHEKAFIEAFVAPRWRDRYRTKGGIPREDLSHKLEGRLDPRRIVPVDDVPPFQDVLEVFGAKPSSATCVFFSQMSDLEGLEWPLQSLVQGQIPAQWPQVYHEEDTIFSIEPGRLALFWPEAPATRFICVADPAARERIRKRFARSK